MSVGVGLVVVIGSIPIGAGTMVLRCFPFSVRDSNLRCIFRPRLRPGINVLLHKYLVFLLVSVLVSLRDCNLYSIPRSFSAYVEQSFDES